MVSDKQIMKKNSTLPKQEFYLNFKTASSKALTTLKGLIEGVACDQELNDLERAKINDWMKTNESLRRNPGFKSVFDSLNEALSDGQLSITEIKDLYWLIERNTNKSYDEITEQIQTLEGLISGIAADYVIGEAEWNYLYHWLENNDQLKGLFPYDEIYDTVLKIGFDKKLSNENQKYLIQAFQWVNNDRSISKDNPFVPWQKDPIVDFKGKFFCITGTSVKAPRKKIEEKVKDYGGQISRDVSGKTDYLVVCTNGNIAWAFASYGRKIENAINIRKQGHKLIIIEERDLWDAFLG